MASGNWYNNEVELFYLQPGALKLGKAMNLMDKGPMVIGDLTLTRDGDRMAILPSSVSANSFPFSSIVLLWTSPSFGDKWYSSRTSFASPDLLPIHETVFLRPWLNECLFLLLFSSISKPKCATDWISTLNSVLLLKLIRSSVIPSCNKHKHKNLSNEEK